jgi:hypothetical protein
MILAVLVGCLLRRWRWIPAVALVSAIWEPIFYELVSKRDAVRMGEPVLHFPTDWRDYLIMSVVAYALFVAVASLFYGLKRAYVWASPEATAKRRGERAVELATAEPSSAPSQQTNPPNATEIFRGVMQKRWLLWGALGTVVALLLGYVVEGVRGYGSLSNWLMDSGENSPLFWAAAGFAIGALGSVLLRRRD